MLLERMKETQESPESPPHHPHPPTPPPTLPPHFPHASPAQVFPLRTPRWDSAHGALLSLLSARSVVGKAWAFYGFLLTKSSRVSGASCCRGEPAPHLIHPTSRKSSLCRLTLKLPEATFQLGSPVFQSGSVVTLKHSVCLVVYLVVTLVGICAMLEVKGHVPP